MCLTYNLLSNIQLGAIYLQCILLSYKNNSYERVPLYGRIQRRGRDVGGKGACNPLENINGYKFP